MVLSVLLGLDVYSAGASPLFRYTLHPKTGITPVAFRTLYLRPSELESDAALVGRTVEFVAEEPIELVDCRVAGGSSIFGRCTVIFELTRPSLAVQGSSSTSDLSPSFVLKVQHINHKSKGCEANVLDKIVRCCASHGAASASSLLIERHVALPEKAASLGLHRSQMDDSALPVLMDPDYPDRRQQESSRRTLDVLVVRNPTPLPIRVDTGRGPQHKFSQACEVFDQLLTLLYVLWDLGIHHRDLSLGNILHHQGHLVLVDWDTGVVAQPGTRVPIAADFAGSFRITEATASYEILACPPGLLSGGYKVPSHALRHDFESSVYWFLHVMDWYVGESVSAELWEELQLRPLANEPTFSPALIRLELWDEGSFPELRQEFLQDLANVDTELHDLVNLITSARPGRLPPTARSDRQHYRCVKQKMVKVQAALRRMLEEAQQPDYHGVLGRYHRLLKLQYETGTLLTKLDALPHDPPSLVPHIASRTSCKRCQASTEPTFLSAASYAFSLAKRTELLLYDPIWFLCPICVRSATDNKGALVRSFAIGRTAVRMINQTEFFELRLPTAMGADIDHVAPTQAARLSMAPFYDSLRARLVILGERLQSKTVATMPEPPTTPLEGPVKSISTSRLGRHDPRTRKRTDRVDSLSETRRRINSPPPPTPSTHDLLQRPQALVDQNAQECLRFAESKSDQARVAAWEQKYAADLDGVPLETPACSAGLFVDPIVHIFPVDSSVMVREGEPSSFIALTFQEEVDTPISVPSPTSVQVRRQGDRIRRVPDHRPSIRPITRRGSNRVRGLASSIQNCM
ncbi:BQ5605_C022g09579 [Microbotryum silenes-dioicae]|uniref:BQ5605_C022g09579 protein n=1 Tax=Microbotryum silenes-dioicae TaxID=796604 RepID=A0A2X0MPT2_9BASI|nr:BQ5605_C022g09579 [Microbotryum silenes-dioicae]